MSKPWELHGVSKATYYRRVARTLDGRRRAATTPDAMLGVLREAVGRRLEPAHDLSLGLLADLLLKHNTGETSAADIAGIRALLNQFDLLPRPGRAAPDASEFAEFQ